MGAEAVAGEVLRIGRFLNLPLGLGVAVLPWLLGGCGAGSATLGTAAGLAIALLSLPRGVVRERYGAWDRCVR